MPRILEPETITPHQLALRMGKEKDMSNTDEMFQLAKIIYDARVESVNGKLFKGRWESEKAKFPTNLRQHNYTIPQPWIDIALDEAKAVLIYMENKSANK